MKDIVLVSGGFDPIHSGHIKLIEDAAKYGDVVVLLNSDKWLQEKKGKEFLKFNERKIIMSALKNVINVISCGELDRTCIDGIKKAILKYPNYNIKFANGGDRNDKTTPETIFCLNNNIEALWHIGGGKTNSSSWILKKWNQK
ncbi:adenylyltransferase/cytidyltransferase family protein [Alphaproteobacteria bacterium]|nr:adenylyltransferase/cytidyltransferase family protein [Alphaproteobacteria bacterium]